MISSVGERDSDCTTASECPRSGFDHIQGLMEIDMKGITQFSFHTMCLVILHPLPKREGRVARIERSSIDRQGRHTEWGKTGKWHIDVTSSVDTFTRFARIVTRADSLVCYIFSDPLPPFASQTGQETRWRRPRSARAGGQWCVGCKTEPNTFMVVQS